jgi:hypothetical protein
LRLLGGQGGAGGELDGERLHDAEERGKPGIAGGRQGFTEGLAPDAGLASIDSRIFSGMNLLFDF